MHRTRPAWLSMVRPFLHFIISANEAQPGYFEREGIRRPRLPPAVWRLCWSCQWPRIRRAVWTPALLPNDRWGGFRDIQHQVIQAGSGDRETWTHRDQALDLQVQPSQSQDCPPLHTQIRPGWNLPECVGSSPALRDRGLGPDFDHLCIKGKGVLVRGNPRPLPGSFRLANWDRQRTRY